MPWEDGTAGCGTAHGSCRGGAELIKERTVESIAHRKRTGGSLGGRPKTSQARADLVLSLRASGDSYRVIREKTGIGLATIRRILVESEVAVV